MNKTYILLFVNIFVNRINMNCIGGSTDSGKYGGDVWGD